MSKHPQAEYLGYKHRVMVDVVFSHYVPAKKAVQFVDHMLATGMEVESFEAAHIPVSTTCRHMTVKDGQRVLAAERVKAIREMRQTTEKPE